MQTGVVKMEEIQIPYIVHESEVARLERIIRRLWILCIIIFVALIATNAAWIWYENQFMDEVTTVEQESESGYNNYIGNDGNITN